MSKPRPDPASQRLAVLVELERRARLAQPDELPFVLVNETSRLIPYTQAALWLAERGRVEAISGVAVPPAESPMVQWLERFFEIAGASRVKDGVVQVGHESMDPQGLRQWYDLLPPECAVLVLRGAWGPRLGYLALFRVEPFSPAELKLLAALADSQGYVLSSTRCALPPRTGWFDRKRRVWAAVLLGLAALLFVPVRQSALAPAEVVSANPLLVRAPMDGVVDKVLVAPNQQVRKGEALFTLDGEQLRSRLLVARKAQEIALVEYQQALQQALTDRDAKAHLAVLRGKVEQQKTEADYLENLLSRVTATAPADGVALYDDQDDWRGRPVLQGQRVMTVADPSQPELQVSLPLAQAIELAPGAQVLFFPNASPDRPQAATLTQASYLAQPTPEAGMAFRLTARFAAPPGGAAPAAPRIGARGTAKCFGERTFLGKAFFAKPISLVRQWFSW